MQRATLHDSIFFFFVYNANYKCYLLITRNMYFNFIYKIRKEQILQRVGICYLSWEIIIGVD